ncbi:hypothetical protein CN311_24085 [Mesorhizobium sanjuanii]|uniref:Copper chaperone PCu(A)C n=1 Tax=Mesorhizobium sanjuanii TaxID=2037900 RepID=A0A2A6F9N8_9HYPH|nr:copper chaperone PCu(A)C [Mesorhizobium sanjuanii]PDQ18564.1 hypothetical protein CN311_24085 [Mesorhizobium sanjuanii]
MGHPACLLAGLPPVFAAEQGVTLSAPWIRLVISSRPAAGYFDLSNDSDEIHQIVGASSPACGTLMLHRSVSQGGTDRMVLVKSVPVAAHGSVSFAPGGYHLMCMSPAPDLKVGNPVPVTLRFGDGGTLSANFPVRGATGK